jgi:hypothetical protein
MFQSLFDTLFGCSHQRTTFPLTPARTAGHSHTGAQRSGTYVTCLDCGREFAYDWKAMRIGQPVLNRVPAVTTQPSFR